MKFDIVFDESKICQLYFIICTINDNPAYHLGAKNILNKKCTVLSYTLHV